MTLLRTLARNLVSMSAMRLGSALVSFSLIWFLARNSNAEFVGAYAFLLGAYAFLQQLPLLGLHLAAVRDVAADADAAPVVATNLGTLGLVAAALMGLACVLTGLAFYPESMHTSFALLGLAMLPTAWVNVAEAILIGRQNMSTVASVNLTEALLRALFSAIVVWQGWGLSMLLLVFLLGRTGAALAYLMSSQLPGWRPSLLDWPRLRRNLTECPVFLGIMVLSAVISRFDLFFLSRLASFADVGIYAIAAKIYEAALMAPSVITSVLYPAFSQAARQDKAVMERMLRTAVSGVFLLALPCAIAVALLSEPLIVVMFGSAYAASAQVLQILIGAVVLVALNQLLTVVLLACHEQRYDLYSLLFSALCTVVMLTVLIPYWGVLGAAWAVLTAMVLQLAVRSLYVHQRLGLRPGFAALWRPLLAGGVMLVVAGLLGQQHSFVMVPAAALAYLLTLFALGGIRLEAVQAMVGLIRARRGVPAP